jgi:hypothetical protein
MDSKKMKLLLENWRKYLTEDYPQYDFEKQLLEEEKIWDFIKDSATAAGKLKEKIYDEALLQFLNISQKVTDTMMPVNEFIQKHIPKSLQAATVWAVSLAAAAKGKPKLAQRIALGKPTAIKDVMIGVGAAVKEEKNETPT